MPFALPPLPFPKDSLAPVISPETLEFHHGKHHQAYVDNLNKLIAGGPDSNKKLEEIIMSAEPGPLFNNAAQVWNHTFYWSCLRANAGGPRGELEAAINRDLGSAEKFREELSNAAASQFGSGWAWLVLDKGKLKVTKTANADLPMKHGQAALLTIDVWEHAYYIDYRNARPKYVAAVIDKLINWEFVAKNLQQALAGARM